MNLRALVLWSATGWLWPQAALHAQDNVFDLRLVEIDSHHHVTYQNFIYARSISGGKYVAQATFLKVPPGSYNEFALALGVRAATVAGAAVYLLAGAGRATDGNYAEPAILVQKATGRLTGALYVQRYVPLSQSGIGQWLLDMLEAQYAFGAIYLGGALYAYQANGDAWLTKIGPKLGLTDKRGATEVRVTRTSRDGSPEILFRRIVAF